MTSESTIADMPDEPERSHYPEVIFPAGNSDFRAVRNRCARACREFNNTPDDADPEERSQKWLDIVRPDRNRAEDGELAVTHDQTFANPSLKAKTPFVKPPVYIDYGVRVHVGGSTFINRNCMIMDTPVADVVIGQGCNIGANCCIVGVTHPVRLDERLQRQSIGQPVTIGDDVWIGANVTILGNITIGSGAVIGACSLVTTNIPPLTLAYGSPARVVSLLSDIKPCSAAAAAAATTALTLEEALRLGNRLPLDLADDDDGPMTTAAGQEAGFDCGLVTPTITVGRRGVGRDGYVCEGDAGRERDGGVVVSSRRRVSVGSSAGSSSTVAVESLRGAGLGREREVRELLRERGRQHRVMRRFEVEALAVMTVVVALLVAFFLAGVYLGARRVLVFG